MAPENQPFHTQSLPHGQVNVSATADGTYNVQVTVQWRSLITGRNERVNWS